MNKGQENEHSEIGIKIVNDNEPEKKSTLKENISNLFKIKSLMTLFILITFCILIFRQNVEISTELVTSVVMSVITYFFAKASDTKK